MDKYQPERASMRSPVQYGRDLLGDDHCNVPPTELTSRCSSTYTLCLFLKLPCLIARLCYRPPALCHAPSSSLVYSIMILPWWMPPASPSLRVKSHGTSHTISVHTLVNLMYRLWQFGSINRSYPSQSPTPTRAPTGDQPLHSTGAWERRTTFSSFDTWLAFHFSDAI
jgi:hypothetical protein